MLLWAFSKVFQPFASYLKRTKFDAERLGFGHADMIFVFQIIYEIFGFKVAIALGRFRVQYFIAILCDEAETCRFQIVGLTAI